MFATASPTYQVRAGERLTHERLLARTAEEFERARITRTALAGRLGVTLATISRALTMAGPKYAAVQRRIIEELTPYRVSAEPTFRVERKN